MRKDVGLSTMTKRRQRRRCVSNVEFQSRRMHRRLMGMTMTVIVTELNGTRADMRSRKPTAMDTGMGTRTITARRKKNPLTRRPTVRIRIEGISVLASPSLCVTRKSGEQGLECGWRGDVSVAPPRIGRMRSAHQQLLKPQEMSVGSI